MSEIAETIANHYPAFEHRGGGSFRVDMMQVEQGSSEFDDPGIAQLIIVGHSNTIGSVELDFGDGWKKHTKRVSISVDVQPANQFCRFRSVGHKKMLVAGLPIKAVVKQLADVDVLTDPFDALYARHAGGALAFDQLQRRWDAMA
jgi:hypothetical protein